MSYNYYVYILTNYYRNVLYVGVTNDLIRRILQHKSGQGGAFTRKYRVHILVHYEATTDIFGALEREKEIKGWSRAKKDLLINTLNPFREDLLPMIM